MVIVEELARLEKFLNSLHPIEFCTHAAQRSKISFGKSFGSII